MKYRCGRVTSTSLLGAHGCSSLKDSIMDMFPLIFAMCYRILSVLLLFACAVPRALGFAVPAFWSWNACEFPKGMCLFLSCWRMCSAGDEDFGQEHCTKMLPHDGLLLHQIQQLFPSIAVFCSAVLCQFSLFSLRRMHTGELIHQPSEELCSN